MCGILGKRVRQSGKWPQQDCTTMFFLFPKNATSERPIAHVPTMIRWRDPLRAPGDATDGRNGGANTLRNLVGDREIQISGRRKKISEK